MRRRAWTCELILCARHVLRRATESVDDCAYTLCQACAQAYDGECGRVKACAQAYDGEHRRVCLPRAQACDGEQENRAYYVPACARVCDGKPGRARLLCVRAYTGERGQVCFPSARHVCRRATERAGGQKPSGCKFTRSMELTRFHPEPFRDGNPRAWRANEKP